MRGVECDVALQEREERRDVCCCYFDGRFGLICDLCACWVLLLLLLLVIVRVSFLVA